MYESMLGLKKVGITKKGTFRVPILKKEYVEVRANNIIEATERAKCFNSNYFVRDDCQAYSYFISTDKSEHDYEYNNLKIAIDDTIFLLTIVKSKNVKLWKKTLFHKSDGSYCVENRLLWSDDTGTLDSLNKICVEDFKNER